MWREKTEVGIVGNNKIRRTGVRVNLSNRLKRDQRSKRKKVKKKKKNGFTETKRIR